MVSIPPVATPEATPPLVEVSADIEPKIHLAAQQNSVPVVRSVTVKSAATGPLDGLALQITFDPPFAEPYVRPLGRLAPGRQVRLSDVDPRFSTRRLMQQTERQSGQVFVRIMRLAEVVAERAYDVEMLAAMEWAGGMVLPELLAAFVMPNEPAIAPVLKSASATLESDDGRGALLGYQARDPAHVIHLLRAVYLAVQRTGITYANPPASFEQAGQRVRTPAEVLHGLGTCLDLSVVLAAAIEQAGLHPFIVVLDGHAFVGCWLTDFLLADPAIDDAAVISKRIRLQEAIVFDSSSVATGATFENAVAEANKLLEDPDRFRFAVDVARARRSRIVPLSLVDEGPDGTVTVTTDVPPATASDEPSPATEDGEPGDRGGRGVDGGRARLGGGNGRSHR